jgi:hypothetical protein
MNFENLRQNDLGQTYFWLPEFGQKPDLSMIPMTYHDHAITAFYLTCQNIEMLERSRAHISQGNSVLIAIGYWFIAIEAYINALVKVACKIKGLDFKEYKGRTIESRIASLFDLLQFEKVEFYKSDIFKKFHEFITFRNEIFHDRTIGEELIFKKTSFCGLPYLANQIDAVQSAIIALEVFHFFRSVYDGLDLMPDIVVQKNTSFCYFKYDVLYNKVVKPMLVESLNKHGFSTCLNLEPVLLKLPISKIAKNNQVKVIIRAEQDHKFDIKPNEASTDICRTFFEDIKTVITFDTEQYFLLPCYTSAALTNR